MKNNYKYSILINSTDSFEDCWIPFFTLFKKYWPDFTGKIYLNTETKIFVFPGLDIECVLNNKNSPNKRIPWSECLIRALNGINSDVLLYMQEDYFLKDSVKDDLIDKFVQLMHDNIEIHCIHLTDQVAPSVQPSDYDKLFYIPQNHKDRVSCQAALWRKEIMLNYLRNYESGWDFEWWGSKRASIQDHNFLAVDKNWVRLNQFEIIPYIFTGVIGGRWFKEVIPLFEKNNILIDYSKRGLFERKNKTLKERIKAKVKRLPIEIRSSMELFNLRIQNIIK
jgi:hypothetical protein